MATINDYISGSYYDSSNSYNWNNELNANAGSFLQGLSVSSDNSSSFSLSDYASIRNGSYKTLLKAYYKQQDVMKKENASDPAQRLALLRSSSGDLAYSVQNMMKDSVWKDRDSVIKALRKFTDTYNDTIDKLGQSNTRSVLKQGAWMTGITDRNAGALRKAGISVTGGNKLEFDEEELTDKDLSYLKSLFTGANSYGAQIRQKAGSIGMAAARSGSAYTGTGAYTEPVSGMIASRVDKQT